MASSAAAAEPIVVQPAGQRPAWAAVWALGLTVATLNASEMLPASLLTPMAAGLDASEGLIGQSVTATAVLAIATSLVVSPLTRRVDRRRLLLGVAAAQVLSNLIVALAPTAGIMLAGRVLLGLTVGAVWGLSASLALRLVPAGSVSRALSIIFGGGSVAMIAATPIGAFLGGVIGWRGVFLAAAALSAAAVLALALSLPRLPTLDTAEQSGLGKTLRLPGLAAGMLGVILFFAGQQVFSTYLRPYLEVVGKFTTTGVAVALLVFGVAGFLGTLVAPVILSRSIRWALTSTAAGQALFLALLFVLDTGSQVTAIALIACWGFASGMIGVGWSTWLARIYPEHAEGGGGILVASIQGAMMVGAIIGGGLIDGVGPKGPLAAAVIFLALGAAHVTFALRGRASGVH